MGTTWVPHKQWFLCRITILDKKYFWLLCCLPWTMATLLTEQSNWKKPKTEMQHHHCIDYTKRILLIVVFFVFNWFLPLNFALTDFQIISLIVTSAFHRWDLNFGRSNNPTPSSEASFQEENSLIVGFEIEQEMDAKVTLKIKMRLFLKFSF
jgi:hypothetical protein